MVDSYKMSATDGGGHGLMTIFFLIESRWCLPASALVSGAAAAFFLHKSSWLFVVAFAVGVPAVTITALLLILVLMSLTQTGGKCDWTPYFEFKDPKEQKKYLGSKVPMQKFYDDYQQGKIEVKQDVYEILLHRHQILRMCFTWADAKYYFLTFLGHNFNHSMGMDKTEIATVYNRGNDFYHWFLGECMIYTSGIYQDVNESLEVAQRRKLDTVCRYVHMKEGDKHLDIGCGWGTLACHAAKYYGSDSTGVTLAKEQAAYCRMQAKKFGVEDRVNILTMDYRVIPFQQFDKITCLEMAEHVGIKNFQNFLLQVKGMLKGDGLFYLQIAGLRRAWQFEDLVWGLFMAKYIFPAADASCPLGWVATQVERAGFEIHRVENCGVHYSLTIKAWYDNWLKNEEQVIEKYGVWWYRCWQIFLGWSAIIAAQGSSTVFMLTLHKNHATDGASVKGEEAKFNRMDMWVGGNPIATQQ
jgi:cyclopropane fatty-acyl-phospholipid synthase-like methyltransferase